MRWEAAKGSAAAFLAAVLALTGGIVCRAAPETISFEEAESMWSAEELEELEGMEDGVSDGELEEALEKYFEEMDGEALKDAGMVSEKITDPVLVMTAEKSGKLRYTLPNGNYFLSSVPSGMVTSDPVDMKLPEGTIGLVERNGKKEAFPEAWHFTEKGCYYVRILILQPPGNTGTDYNIYEVDFYFTIIDKTDNTIGAVPAPEGFAITGVRLDGKQQALKQGRCYFLHGDGNYEIMYEALGDEPVGMATRFRRDTMAPFLSFSPEPEPGGTLGPVEFYPSEQGCKVMMNYNGNRGYAVGSTLAAAGTYELSVEDGAGNSRTYYIKLRQTYNPVDWRFFAMIGVAAAVAAVRLLFLRRDMRVL